MQRMSRNCYPEFGALISRRDPTYVCDLLRKYYGELNACPPRDWRESPLDRLERQFKFHPYLPSNDDASKGHFQCCHVTITPTRMILEGPYAAHGNRIIREYSRFEGCFLRVDFRDEDRLQYRWAPDVDGPDYLDDRAGGILKNGFELGGRRFEFLAYSTSALREHAVWFMTPFKRDGVWVDSEFI